MEYGLQNCDYKDLVSEMKNEGVMVDLILTDPPTVLAVPINWASLIWDVPG